MPREQQLSPPSASAPVAGVVAGYGTRVSQNAPAEQERDARRGGGLGAAPRSYSRYETRPTPRSQLLPPPPALAPVPPP